MNKYAFPIFLLIICIILPYYIWSTTPYEEYQSNPNLYEAMNGLAMFFMFGTFISILILSDYLLQDYRTIQVRKQNE